MWNGIYLDNSTTARPSATTISRMVPFFAERWGSLYAPHQQGQQLFADVVESLKAVYSLIGAKEKDTVIITSSGAEGANQAIFSTYMDITRSTGKNHFITTHIEEAPSLMAINRLEKLGCIGCMVAPNAEGMITVDAIAEALTPRTALLSLSWANGLTGVIQPVAEIAMLCKQRGIKLHLDATHVLGKLCYDLEEIDPDFISFNGEQLHAPAGVGGLYIKAGTACSPLIAGGLEQGGYRAGSLNVPGLIALGSAAKEALEARDFLNTEIARLRDRLEEGILQKIPDAIPFFRDQERLPHCTAIGFPGVANEALLYLLNRKQLFASIGGGNFQQLRLLLAASGIEEPLPQTAVSFSLARDTTEDTIEHAITIITYAVRHLRRVSEALENDF